MATRKFVGPLFRVVSSLVFILPLTAVPQGKIPYTLHMENLQLMVDKSQYNGSVLCGSITTKQVKQSQKKKIFASSNSIFLAQI